MTKMKELIAGISARLATPSADSSTPSATLAVIIDDGATEHTERLPPLPDVAHAMSAYGRLSQAAMEHGYTLRGGTLEIDGRVFRVSQNGRLWDGSRAVTEAQAQRGAPGPNTASPRLPSHGKPTAEHGR